MVEQQELIIESGGGGSGGGRAATALTSNSTNGNESDDSNKAAAAAATANDGSSGTSPTAAVAALAMDADIAAQSTLLQSTGDGADDGDESTGLMSPTQQPAMELSPISRHSNTTKAKDTRPRRQSDPEAGVNEDDDDEWEMVPPDGGWGWLILAGSTLVNILVPGTIKSFGVLFVEFLEAFDASPAQAAWIPSLCYFLYSSLGPLSSILSVKYSYRTVTLIGGTFAAVGMMVSYFASSLTFLYISYGLLVGTGAGLSFPPTVYIVTSYFVRLRGLANGICISGSAFGSIILPPLLRILLEEYGYRGAVLIMGGITLNTWVAAIFYEPVENHMKRALKRKQQKPLLTIDDEEFFDEPLNGQLALTAGGAGANGGINQQAGTIEEEDEGIFVQCTATPATTRPPFNIDPEATPQLTPRPTKHLSFAEPNGFVRSASAAVVQSAYDRRDRGDSNAASDPRQRKISTPIRELPAASASTASFGAQLSSTPSLYAQPDGQGRFSQTRLSRLTQLRGPAGGGSVTSSGMRPKRSPSVSSFQYVSTPYHGSTLSFQPQEFASHLSLKSLASSINPVGGCKKKPADEETGAGKSSDADKKSGAKPAAAAGANKLLDLSLLRDPAYLVVLISNSTNAIGYTNFIILLPAYALALGFDKNRAAYLLSIVSTLDLVGRIGGSALSDWTLFIPKTWYFVGGLAVSGFSLAALPQASSYGAVSFWCALFGLASGTYVGITAVIMADMLGTERLTSTYGISLFVNGLLQLVGPPLCGWWLVWAKTYVPLFTTLGMVLMGGASLWGFMPMINRRRREAEEARIREEMEAEREEAERRMAAAAVA